MNGVSRSTSALVIGAGLIALASGCASSRTSHAPADRAVLLSERAPLSGRTCRVSAVPETLPAPADLVDERELTRSVREMTDPGTRPDGYVLLSMVYDRHGSNIRRAVIEHNVSPAVADSVQKLVFAHRKTFEERPDQWGARLRVDVGDPVRLQVGRQEFCDPAPRDAELAFAIQHTHGAGMRMRGRVRENLVWMRLTVGPRGTVQAAELDRGTLGNTILLQNIVDYMRGFFFHPALEDGFPTTGTIRVPIRIREG